MVDSNDVDTLSSEIESRLDDLFGENDIPVPVSKDRDVTDHYPLAELKTLILSIDWEITDEVLETFLQQLKDLKLTYEHDRIVLTFLQILNSLGDYIKTNRAMSHPKTFKILNSVFYSLDTVVLSKDMEETEKKKTLRAEINRYNQLRAQIRQGKTEAVSAITKKKKIKKKEEELGVATTEASNVVKEKLATAEQSQEPIVVNRLQYSDTNLAEAVREIKQYIHAEIKALKEEIKSLRDQK